MKTFTKLWEIFVRNLEVDGDKESARSALKVLRIANKYNRRVLLGNLDNFSFILQSFQTEPNIDWIIVKEIAQVL